MLQAAAAAGVNLKKVKTLGRLAAPLLVKASTHFHLACVRFLIDFGVDVNEVYEDSEGKVTAFDMAEYVARDRGYENGSHTVAMLRAAGGKCYAEL